MRMLYLTTANGDREAVLFTDLEDPGDLIARDSSDSFSRTAPRWIFEWEAVLEVASADEMPACDVVYERTS